MKGAFLWVLRVMWGSIFSLAGYHKNTLWHFPSAQNFIWFESDAMARWLLNVNQEIKITASLFRKIKIDLIPFLLFSPCIHCVTWQQMKARPSEHERQRLGSEVDLQAVLHSCVFLICILPPLHLWKPSTSPSQRLCSPCTTTPQPLLSVCGWDWEGWSRVVGSPSSHYPLFLHQRKTLKSAIRGKCFLSKHSFVNNRGNNQCVIRRVFLLNKKKNENKSRLESDDFKRVCETCSYDAVAFGHASQDRVQWAWTRTKCMCECH